MDMHLAGIGRRSALWLSLGGAVIAALICKTTWAEDGRASRSPFARDNLAAWCIVPFDAAKRTPAERAE